MAGLFFGRSFGRSFGKCMVHARRAFSTSLEGKKAIVFGGTSGIGLATTIGLKNLGESSHACSVARLRSVCWM